MQNKPISSPPPLVGNVLLCGKKQAKGKWIIWPLKAPGLKVAADGIEKAEALLVEKMWERYDLDEPFAIRYQKDVAKKTEGQSDLLQISPNETTAAVNPGQYFSKGFCDVCQSGQGARNDELLTIDHIPKKANAGMLVRFHPHFKCGMRVGMVLLHKSICDALKKAGDVLFELRKVQIKTGQNSDFYEVIPAAVFPCVVPLSKKSDVGGRCVRCGTTFVYAEFKMGSTRFFISKKNAQLIRARGGAGIKNLSAPVLCVSGTIWEKISKVKRSDGLVIHKTGELEESQINKKPKFAKITHFKV